MEKLLLKQKIHQVLLKKLFNVQLKVIERDFIDFIDVFVCILAAPKFTKKPTDTEALIHTDAVFTADI